MISNPPAMIGWLHVGRPALLRKCEAAVLAVAGRRRFGQPDHAVLAIEIETVVREDQRPLADAAIAPRHGLPVSNSSAVRMLLENPYR